MQDGAAAQEGAAARAVGAPSPSAPGDADASPDIDADELAELLKGLASDREDLPSAADNGSSDSSGGGSNGAVNADAAGKQLREAAQAAEQRGDAVFAYPASEGPLLSISLSHMLRPASIHCGFAGIGTRAFRSPSVFV